ncbi:hypothetical protein GQ607_004463 [Colletotrichum asianum]|uniref:Uncharacterized protein n=1 Tax=Colletotrichum asianum TaxID=702518 RepID=A0A8H3WM29_9PEZI|nr:hypothetical protein GQ607_004463 [Colletotrichum asianum]
MMPTHALPSVAIFFAKPPHHHTTFPYFPSHKPPKPKNPTNVGGGTRQLGAPSGLSQPAGPSEFL